MTDSPMHGVADPSAPARLAVGLVSAGRVGTALGQALESVGHVVGAVVARSAASRERVAKRLPDSEIFNDPAQVAARSELLILAVPDDVLPDVVTELADGGQVRPGTIVMHVAGAHGTAVLAPLTSRGALGLAIHPAMTFVGGAQDTERMRSACFAITADDEIGHTVGASLVYEIGGQPVRIDEADRTLYHAALAHGANHLVALISDATTVLRSVIERADADGTAAPLRSAQDMLAPLVTAALGNVLDLGPSALTGPVARGDADAVAAHLAALREWGASAPSTDATIVDSYLAQARRAAAHAAPAPALARVLGEAS
ncbi:DUF2520 domain-containing protein [uncultured Gordonia sp.]|uniref:Rossmann-like and DUF2520 domain-containing protein n=1 Tax=Gordonia sp. (in: high G+C Gram-positive bacteria) TaxID=84139 RepID=UPI0026075634|nr:DUF2520 domain-containing protein [uncultured Gordonia sp.]HNP55575.1 DUF2520 domain-containing protein [Gordonia sp. (in: high G+C Gram-positive bacteria)]